MSFQHAAFLRGMNVGGRRIANEELRQFSKTRQDPVTFQLANKQTRAGVLIQPADAPFPPRDARIVVWQEGGPGVPMINTWAANVENPYALLPNLGVAVLVVPLSGRSLSESLEAYFASSEQLPTRVLLAATPGLVAGMLVQRLPGEGGKAAVDPAALEAAWMKADHAMAALTRTELLEDDVEQRLVKMFGVDEVRVFGAHEVTFECRCSRERVANVLRSLGVEEVRSVIAEQGACTVTCEFCQKPYKFDAIDVEQLFADFIGVRGSDRIN